MFLKCYFKNVSLFMFPYLWAKFHWKVPFGKCFCFCFWFFFFKFWPKSKWRKRKIGYLAAILKRFNISIFFPELWFFIARTYMVQISLQNSGGKVVFLSDPPWAPTGVKVPRSLKSVNTQIISDGSTKVIFKPCLNCLTRGRDLEVPHNYLFLPFQEIPM